jgi:pyruvate kinase
MLTRGLVPTVVSVPEDHERAFSGDNAESEAPVAAKKCVMAAVRHARRQMLCRPGDKVVAMYNVERRCAVIRVIEVTDDLLKNDETTRAEALVGEPAGVDPAVVPVE